MRIESTNPAATGTDESDCAPKVVFELLASDRRRYALHYLFGQVGAVPVAELAEQVALREGYPTRDRCERVATDLSHRHLPKLTDAGVARYDPERETVELLDAAETVSPFLKLVAADDLR